MWSAGDGDDNRRFLADLRALRDTAALEFDELAARAHYPSDVLKEAESGPSLPTLPILAAYVRACDGDVPAREAAWPRPSRTTRSGSGRCSGVPTGVRTGVRAAPRAGKPRLRPPRARAGIRTPARIPSGAGARTPARAWTPGSSGM